MRGIFARALAVGLVATGAALPVTALAAEPPDAPYLSLTSLATPTNFVPGDATGSYSYDLRIANLGAKATDGSAITISDTLPAGLEVKTVELRLRTAMPGFSNSHDYGPPAEGVCSVGKPATQEIVTCTLEESIPGAVEAAKITPGEERRLVIEVFTPGTIADGTALTNRVEVEGGGAPDASFESENKADHEVAKGGLSFYRAKLGEPDGSAATQAGSHPYEFVSGFAVNTKPGIEGGEAAFVPAGGDLKDVEVALPAGLVGNPTATERCTPQQFDSTRTIPVPEGFYTANDCPDGSAVGMALVQQIEGKAGITPVPLYNLVPAPGMPAQLGAQILNLPFYIDAEVHPADGYKVTGTLRNMTQVKRLTAATVVIWGTPDDPRHDALRGSCINELEYFPISTGNCEAGVMNPKPFLRLPTSCPTLLSPLMSFDNWTHPGEFISAAAPAPSTTGCGEVPFQAGLEVNPESHVADSPTGLGVDLHMPQEEHEGQKEVGLSDLDNVSVALPAGLAINPAGANGLGSCGPEQIDLHGNGPASCPPNSRIGEVEVKTPLLEEPLKGGVYVATPHNNPFDSLLAIYIAVNDPQTGVVVKLAGKVQADPVTGQLTSSFADNPQVPFEDFKLDFFGGPAAALRTPQTCGSFATAYTLSPWSGNTPVTDSSAFAVSAAPGGGSCPTSVAQLPNSPSFAAGTATPTAGAYSSFVIKLRREDDSQEFASLSLTPPPGLLANLTGVPYCPESALAAAAARTGREEEASPACPAASQVGTVQVGAGAGPNPYYAHGRAYLAGPYKGAPLSLAIVTPATAGPFDLGTVVVRTALQVDPETARITAVSDPIPSILQGIPLDVRSVDVMLDRPSFTLNPTSCDPFEVSGMLTGTAGSVASLKSRFQALGCPALNFKPKLRLSLKGQANRAGHPALRAELRMPGGNANIARAQVGLPHSEFVDQGNLNKVCTQPELKSSTCPASSVYGHAKAWTPLLEKPLEGPVYLGVGYGHRLPDLVADLNGQIRILLHGRIDTTRQHGLRNTFEVVPDAPVSRFVLEMKGGKRYGLLENSEPLCKAPHRASALFTAQNGKQSYLRPLLKVSCSKKAKKRQAPARR